jgi:superfamily II DNA or RNA helicase/HKD family nuclease
MKEGFYEKIMTETIAASLEKETDKTFLIESFNKADGPGFISRYFQDILNRALNQIAEESDEKAKKKLIDFSNELVQLTSKFLEDPEFIDDQITTKGEILIAFFHKSTFAQTNLKEHIKETFPITGLSESALFNGSKHTPSLESELKKEMLTSDEVWWLVSFLKFEGVRLFEQVLRKLEAANKPVKIICTVYMGATDLKAIDFLSEFSNVEIKISFNTNQERLHAKSYLFMRNTGFHTAYIGSSNLSRSALTNGLEWNLKVTQQEIPHIISKCRSTFETYWNDVNFELYDPALHREKLQHALEKGKMKKSEDDISKFFDLSPFPFQQQILDQLQDCRDRGENKNLVVAATGTGKTVISAFDFKRFIKENPTAKFLFVAHREEILRQACYTFRQVLKNNDFGELWFSGQTPKSYNQLFVSIQTMNNRIKEIQLAPDFYDYIVIDEVHHSAASSYQSLLNYFTPKILLGLTATPERHDGEDISKYFGHAISAEIRLPDALNQKLLCPFQYFGISEQSDISRVSWRRGRYDISELEKIYSEDNRRVLDILRNCQKYLGDFQAVKALGYCVSKKHAEFMAKEFQAKGLKAAYLHSDNGEDRKVLVQQLRKGEINYLFVVEIFNEGVDIPEIDTLLFLRPTESLTVFLQQLGRGLRLYEDKTCLTVLDFVGQQHAEYSFEHKFRAMLGKTHTKVKEELLNDFPHLPLGCSITLEETAKETILRNIQNAYGAGEKSLLKAMERFKQDYDVPFTLKNFCEYMDIELYALYKSKHLFFELKNKLDGKDFVRNEFSEKLARTFGNTWLGSDSKSYFEFILKFISGEPINETELKVEQQMLMLYIDLFDAAPQVKTARELKNLLLAHFADVDIKEETKNYFNYRLEKLECIEKSISLRLPNALNLHGRFTRNQILAGVSKSSLGNKDSNREGVCQIHEHNTELLFVTLFKKDVNFNSSTMYRDYFINEQLFHWQSQNKTSPESPVGQSYINQRLNNKDILLFVRESSSDENGVTMGFVFCGKLHYIQHEGRKPMSITWRLETPPPALLLEEGKKLGVG